MDCEGSFIEIYTGQLYSTAGVVLLLQHSDNLSKTLQSPHITAAEGQRLASMTIATLSKCRSDEANDLFWKKVEHSCQSLDIEEPTLPRKKKLPKKLDEGSEGILFPNPNDYYRKNTG